MRKKRVMKVVEKSDRKKRSKKVGEKSAQSRGFNHGHPPACPPQAGHLVHRCVVAEGEGHRAEKPVEESRHQRARPE